MCITASKVELLYCACQLYLYLNLPLPTAGVKQYTLGSRFACLGVKFLEYSLAGITCGFIGQGIANSLMMLK